MYERTEEQTDGRTDGRTDFWPSLDFSCHTISRELLMFNCSYGGCILCVDYSEYKYLIIKSIYEDSLKNLFSKASNLQ